jgi:hypothetical protein
MGNAGLLLKLAGGGSQATEIRDLEVGPRRAQGRAEGGISHIRQDGHNTGSPKF